MKLIKLCASNLFGLASNSEFDFTESDLIALTGANGSGKSSLMDAVRTACFGEASPARNVSLKDYISRGSASASVSLEFLDRDGVRLRVTRSFSKNSKGAVSGEAVLEEYHNGLWNGIGGGTTEVNEIIAERILPAPPQPGKTPNEVLKQAKASFDVAALVSQGNINKILSLSPGDLFELISSALDIRGGEILKSESKELKRIAEEETGRLSARISGLEDSLAELKDKTELRKELNEIQNRKNNILKDILSVEEQTSSSKEIAAAASSLIESNDRYSRLKSESSDSIRRCFIGEVRVSLDALKESCKRYGADLKKVKEARDSLKQLSASKSEQEDSVKEYLDLKRELDIKFESLSKLSALYGILTQLKETEEEIKKAESELKTTRETFDLAGEKETECKTRKENALSAKYSLALYISNIAAESLKSRIFEKEEGIVESLKDTLSALSENGVIDLNKIDIRHAEEFLKKIMKSSFTTNLKEIGGLQEELKRELRKTEDLCSEAETASIKLIKIPETAGKEAAEVKLSEADIALKKLEENLRYIENRKTELNSKISSIEAILAKGIKRAENFRNSVKDILEGAPEPTLDECSRAKNETGAINTKRTDVAKKIEACNNAIHSIEQKIAAQRALIVNFEESGKALRIEDIESKKSSFVNAISEAERKLKITDNKAITEAKAFDPHRVVAKSKLDAILKDLSIAERAVQDYTIKLDRLMSEYKSKGYDMPNCNSMPDSISHAFFSAYYDSKVRLENMRTELSGLDAGAGKLRGDIEKRESTEKLIDAEREKYDAMLAPLSYVRECAKLADGSNFTRFISDRMMEMLLDGVNASLHNLGTNWTLSSDGGKLSVDDGSGEVRPVAGMSGGEKTLISLLLLRSISNYGLLWIDEGLAMLDEGRLAGILETIADSGDTKQIIFATHDQDLARSFPVMWNMRNGVKETLENEPLLVAEEIDR